MNVEVSISVGTLLVAAGIVAVAGALAPIGSALLTIFVSFFSVAVLSPVATAMERRLGWSRALCSTVLVLGIAARRRPVGARAGDGRRGQRVQPRPAADRG
jgi:predicted PurR-regulated permease PerM